MGIELVFASSEGRSSLNKGAVVPPWYNSEGDYSTWYTASNPFDYYYWYNILNDTIDNEMYIQYGTNMSGWGSGRFFIQDLEIVEQEENTDGSITVTVRSRLRRFRQRITETTAGGYSIRYNLKIFGTTVFSYSGLSSDTINQGASEWYSKTFTVDPQETIDGSGIEFNIIYPNGDAPESNVSFGFGLYNPNPLHYVPMAIRKSGTWKDLNSNNGTIERRISGNWVDKSNENVTTSREEGKGKNRIRKNGFWLQLPKMIGNDTD